MTISIQAYQAKQEMFAQAISDEAQGFIAGITDQQINVAMSALDLFFGWFNDDMARLNETDKKGNVTATFIDGLPDVDSVEPEAKDKRAEARGANKMFEWYWATNKEGKDVLVSFYEEAGVMMSRGKEYQRNIKAADQLLASPPVALSDNHPCKAYNDMDTVQLGALRTVNQKQLNNLSSMCRKAVHLYQQHKRFHAIKYFVSDPNDVASKGLRLSFVAADDGSFVRTPKPIVLTDSIAANADRRTFSVSSFLKMNVNAAIGHMNTGVNPLAALRKTLKHEASEAAQEARVTINMPSEELAEAFEVITQWFDNPERQKAFMLKIKDNKHGLRLKAAALDLLFETLKPLLDDPSYNQMWLAAKSAAVDMTNKQNETEQRKDAIRQDIGALKQTAAVQSNKMPDHGTSTPATVSNGRVVRKVRMGK